MRTVRAKNSVNAQYACEIIWMKNISLSIEKSSDHSSTCFDISASMSLLYYVYQNTSASISEILIFAIRRWHRFHQRSMILTAISWILKRKSSRSNIWFACACVFFLRTQTKPTQPCWDSCVNKKPPCMVYLMLSIHVWDISCSASPWSHSRLHVHILAYA